MDGGVSSRRKRVVADLNCQRHQNKSDYSIEPIRRAGTV